MEPSRISKAWQQQRNDVNNPIQHIRVTEAM